MFIIDSGRGNIGFEINSHILIQWALCLVSFSFFLTSSHFRYQYSYDTMYKRLLSVFWLTTESRQEDSEDFFWNDFLAVLILIIESNCDDKSVIGK